MARTGKIARLPFAIQEQLNRRILNNEPATTLLPWLNSQPEVRAVLDEQFSGLDVNDQNLSNWKADGGGFEDWKKEQQRLDDTRHISRTLLAVAEDGKNIFDGAAAVAGGKLYSILQSFDEKMLAELLESNPKNFPAFIRALAALQGQGRANAQLKMAEERLKQRERELDLSEEKMKWSIGETILKAVKEPEFQAILNSGKSKRPMLADIVRYLFPPPPAKEAASQ